MSVEPAWPPSSELSLDGSNEPASPSLAASHAHAARSVPAASRPSTPPGWWRPRADGDGGAAVLGAHDGPARQSVAQHLWRRRKLTCLDRRKTGAAVRRSRGASRAGWRVAVAG